MNSNTNFLNATIEEQLFQTKLQISELKKKSVK